MHNSRRIISILSLAALFTVAIPLAFRAAPAPDTLLIINAQLADGTGAPLINGALRIRGNRIMSVGKLSPAPGERVIDARGLVLAPGFIDVHNHSLEGLDSDPLAETQIAQGITTAVEGPDGESPWPVKDWIETRKQHPAALNLAIFAGHATIRSQVMGKDFKRVATPAEIEKMVQLTWQAMNEGAIGLSSGLEYEVGSYSNTAELIAIARSAAEHGGIYSTHIRDEADKAFDALLEEIEIAEQAHIPVDHSHIKLGTVGVWGKAPEYIRVIEEARNRGKSSFRTGITKIPRASKKLSPISAAPIASPSRNSSRVPPTLATRSRKSRNPMDFRLSRCISASFAKAMPPTPKPK